MSNNYEKLFTFYTSPNLNKLRVGSNNDGGYVIIDSGLLNNSYDAIISGGAGDNISFEESLINKLVDIPCYLFDDSVNIDHNKINFYKLRIDKNNTKIFNLLDIYKNIFLKLDIEGGEHELLSVIDDNQILNCKQIVIEIHSLVDIEKINNLNKLYKYHTLVHLHANNCCPLITTNNFSFNIPAVFELTLIRNSDIPDNIKLFPNRENLPLSIDQKNLTFHPDILLNYYPFKHDI